jgi:hypothetical protein
MIDQGPWRVLNDNVRQSRSDPIPMPRTALDVVADLGCRRTGRSASEVKAVVRQTLSEDRIWTHLRHRPQDSRSAKALFVLR